MVWRRGLAIVLAFVLMAAACGDDDDDASDPLEFDQGDLQGFGLLSPSVCIEGEPSAPADEIMPVDPAVLARLVGEFLGPVYRPGLLVGPSDFDPDDVADQVQLERVALTTDITMVVDGEARQLGDDQVTVINDTVSFWWIASAAAEELLDPVNYWASTGFDPDGLAPVPVLIPDGGHQYGPSGPATSGGSGYGPGEVGGFDGTVGIIDTSFTAEPDGQDDSIVGHGAFIEGIVRPMLPNATVRTVDMGPEGQNLATVLEPAVQAIYTGDPFGMDVLQLLIALAALGTDDVSVSAVNMSFGTYSCGDPTVPPPHLEAVLGLASGGQVFAAAGNDGVDTPWWPAAFSAGDPAPNLGWVHGVGALDALDDTEDVVRPGEWATFSNHGGWVTTCEEGEGITATPPVGSEWTWSGTSFAAPQAMARSLGDAGSGGPAPCPNR